MLEGAVEPVWLLHLCYHCSSPLLGGELWEAEVLSSCCHSSLPLGVTAPPLLSLLFTAGGHCLLLLNITEDVGEQGGVGTVPL